MERLAHTVSIALLAALLAAATSGCAAGPRRQKPAEPLGGFHWARDQRDIGTVWLTEELRIPLRLINESAGETYEVFRIWGGCTCTSVAPASVTLGPGEEAEVTATIDLTCGPPPGALQSDYRELTEMIAARARDPSGRERVRRCTIEGLLRPSYDVEPSVVCFGTVFRGEAPLKTVRVECLAEERVRGVEIRACPPGMDVSAREAPEAENTFELRLTPRPGIAYGRMRHRLRFRAVVESGPFASWFAPVTALVEDDVHAMPRQVLLGAIPQGESRSAEVTLQSHRGEEFAVTGVETSADEVQVVGDASAYATSHHLTISVSPAAEGTFGGEAWFNVRTAAGRKVTVSVPVKGWVVSPGIL
ncbi:MAG: hypothetical protein PVJ27_08085 [Candidatus Brocadiaceae bacterium]|jgi:hypothetical protein